MKTFTKTKKSTPTLLNLETSNTKLSFLNLWFQGKTLLLTTLLGWMPLFPGQILRNLFYRTIFKQIGYPIQIRPNVRFTNAHWISIDDQVTIDRSVNIDNFPENDIYLGKKVKLHEGVRISCRGQNGKVSLGNKVCIDRGVDLRIHHGGQTIIGNNTYIGPYTCISGYGNIEIGNDCLIASHSAIYAHNHTFSNPDKKINEQGFTVQGIKIGDDCWLGNGVKVVDGVSIGKGCVIGAGAVVTKDIPPYSIAVGVPAKVISKRSQDLI